MTHKKSDCLERPRKVGAKFTGTNFAPDEYLNEQPSLTLTFDGKRDRWNGYDPSTHLDVVEDYAKMEELRKSMKKDKMTKGDVDPTEVRNTEVLPLFPYLGGPQMMCHTTFCITPSLFYKGHRQIFNNKPLNFVSFWYHFSQELYRIVSLIKEMSVTSEAG